MKKKAQLQNMESIAVIIIVIILIIFGIIYASNQRKGSLEDERQRTLDIRTMRTATNIISLDYIKCSEAGASLQNCADIYKIESVSKVAKEAENHFYFNDLFGDAEIKFVIYENLTHGNRDKTRNITIFEAPPEAENKTSTPVRSPVIVRDPINRINYFALLEVTTFR